MHVYDFAPDLDLSKEGEGSIFGVKGIEVSAGIVYAKVVTCAEVKDYNCDRSIFYDCHKHKDNSYKDSLLSRSGCHRGGVGGALG